MLVICLFYFRMSIISNYMEFNPQKVLGIATPKQIIYENNLKENLDVKEGSFNVANSKLNEVGGGSNLNKSINPSYQYGGLGGIKESAVPNIEERRSSFNSISPKIANEINECLNKIEDFNFNIFELDNLVQKNSLLYVSSEIFSLLNFFEDVIDEITFRNFLIEISDGYTRESPYHNDLHAADVLQTTFVMMEKGSFYYKCSLLEIDYIAILVAAICHDFKHPGLGNSYLVNSRHSIAMSFNGKFRIILNF